LDGISKQQQVVKESGLNPSDQCRLVNPALNDRVILYPSQQQENRTTVGLDAHAFGVMPFTNELSLSSLKQDDKIPRPLGRGCRII
jgi:hypothetical protein